MAPPLQPKCNCRRIPSSHVGTPYNVFVAEIMSSNLTVPGVLYLFAFDIIFFGMLAKLSTDVKWLILRITTEECASSAIFIDFILVQRLAMAPVFIIIVTVYHLTI